MKSVAPVLKGNVMKKRYLLFLVIKLTPVYFTSLPMLNDLFVCDLRTPP